MNITVERYEEYQIGNLCEDFSLWSPESFEDSGVEDCYLAVAEDGEIVGFQTVNLDGECVAIEIKEEFQGQGIARSLIEESGCYRPERDENPSFWEWAYSEFA